jgi:hypothetical protein
MAMQAARALSDTAAKSVAAKDGWPQDHHWVLIGKLRLPKAVHSATAPRGVDLRGSAARVSFALGATVVPVTFSPAIRCSVLVCPRT